ncbi:MAG: S-methyl-5'-thioadenosine phosphorylase, partial [Desulfocapsaceae bacterium]
MIKIAIIGGSGLDDPDILNDPVKLDITTKYGAPSSTILSDTINDTQILVLARHGIHHQYSPTQVNNRANI